MRVLYLIKKLCETYGWEIKETGELEKGAQFTITTPEQSEHGKTNYEIS